ncbi:RICIN domain-containing protein [Pseudoxanthomonas wuyuanensis]
MKYDRSRRVSYSGGFAAVAFLIFASSAFNVSAASSTIVRSYTGECAVPATMSSGAQILHATCDGSDAQLWKVEFMDKGGYGTDGAAYFRLRNVQSGHCIDLQTVSTGDGIRLRQNVCNFATTQQWKAPNSGTSRNAQSYQHNVNRHSGKCMDIPPDTSPIQQWTCGNVNNQKWFIAD